MKDPLFEVQELRVGWLNGLSFSISTGAGVPREQRILKGHLPRVIYHQVYLSIRSQTTFSATSDCSQASSIAVFTALISKKMFIKSC